MLFLQHLANVICDGCSKPGATGVDLSFVPLSARPLKAVFATPVRHTTVAQSPSKPDANAPLTLSLKGLCA